MKPEQEKICQYIYATLFCLCNHVDCGMFTETHEQRARELYGVTESLRKPEILDSGYGKYLTFTQGAITELVTKEKWDPINPTDFLMDEASETKFKQDAMAADKLSGMPVYLENYRPKPMTPT